MVGFDLVGAIEQEELDIQSRNLKTKKRLKLVLNYPGKDIKEWLLKHHSKKMVKSLEEYKRKGKGKEVLPIPKAVEDREVIYQLDIQGFHIVSFGIFDLDNSTSQSILSGESANQATERFESDDDEEEVIGQNTTVIASEIESNELTSEQVEELSNPQEVELEEDEEEYEWNKNKVIIVLERVTKASKKKEDFKPFAQTFLSRKYQWAGIYINPQEASQEICISTTQVSGRNRQELINSLEVRTLEVKKDYIQF